MLKGLIRVSSPCHPEIIGHVAALEAQGSLTTEHVETITWLVWPILYLCQPRFATLANHPPGVGYTLSIGDDTLEAWNAKPIPAMLPVTNARFSSVSAILLRKRFVGLIVQSV
jgi:hypothetical protein